MAQWWALGSIVGGLCGLICGAFLLSLKAAEAWRSSHPILLAALPLCGLVMGFGLSRLDPYFQRGNVWVGRALRQDGVVLSALLVPVAFLCTVSAHFFGASVGQEGTAVQMGAGAADLVAQKLHLDKHRRHEILLAGVAGGFGAVFGTPIAGAIFALEFAQPGKLRTRAWLPAVIASCAGSFITTYLGCTRITFPWVDPLPLDAFLAVKWLIVGAIAALAASAFVRSLETVKHVVKNTIPSLPLRMAAGGVLVATLGWVLGSQSFFGGGLPLIDRAFAETQLSRWMWAGKAIFTLLSLGFGFIGGEVTPMFVMGACLGNNLSSVLNIPLHSCVGVTMVALFAAASKTPIAMAVMAIESMGLGVWPHAAVATGISVYLSGRVSIYSDHPEGDVGHKILKRAS